jgi:hypothetical protein
MGFGSAGEEVPRMERYFDTLVLWYLSTSPQNSEDHGSFGGNV